MSNQINNQFNPTQSSTPPLPASQHLSADQRPSPPRLPASTLARVANRVASNINGQQQASHPRIRQDFEPLFDNQPDEQGIPLPKSVNVVVGGDSVGNFDVEASGKAVNKNNDNSFTLKPSADGTVTLTINNKNRQNDFQVSFSIDNLQQLENGATLEAVVTAVGDSNYGGENHPPKVTITKTSDNNFHIEADFSEEQINHMLSTVKNRNITGAPTPSEQQKEEAITLLRSGQGKEYGLVKTVFENIFREVNNQKERIKTNLALHAGGFLEGVNQSQTTHAFTHDSDASSASINDSIKEGTQVLTAQATRVRSEAESLVATLQKAVNLGLSEDEIIAQLNEGFRAKDHRTPPFNSIDDIHKFIKTKQEVFFKDANAEMAKAYSLMSGTIASEDLQELLDGLNTAFNIVSGVSGLADAAKGVISSIRSLRKSRAAFQKAQHEAEVTSFPIVRTERKINQNIKKQDKLQEEIDELDATFGPISSIGKEQRKAELNKKIEQLEVKKKVLEKQKQAQEAALAETEATAAKKQQSYQHEKAIQYTDRSIKVVKEPTTHGSTFINIASRHKFLEGSSPEAVGDISDPVTPQAGPNAGPEEQQFYKTVSDLAYELLSQKVDANQIPDNTVHTEYQLENHFGTYRTYARSMPSAEFQSKVQELARKAQQLNEEEKANNPESSTRWVVVSNRSSTKIGRHYNFTFIMQIDKNNVPPATADGEPRLIIGNNPALLRHGNQYGTGDEAFDGRVKNSWNRTYYPSGSVNEVYVGDGYTGESSSPSINGRL